MSEQTGSPFVYGKFTQALWNTALSKDIERSRPWTRNEVHAWLMRHKGIDSMKKVLMADHNELLKVFGGEPIVEELSDSEIPFDRTPEKA